MQVIIRYLNAKCKVFQFPQAAKMDEPIRCDAPTAEEEGTFKTPTLRESAKTLPHMHNGYKISLIDTVNFYNDGGQEVFPFDGPKDELMIPLELTPEEKQDLVRFMETLDGEPLAPSLLTAPPP